MARGGLGFDGIGAQQVTMLAGAGIKALVTTGGRDSVVGLPVVVSANGTVDLGTNKDTVFGFIDVYENDGHAGVQFRGFREGVVTATTAPAVGKCVTTDGAGKIKASETLESVRAPIVVEVDSTAKTATVFLG